MLDTGIGIDSGIIPFLSPPVQFARWAHISCVLGLTFSVYSICPKYALTIGTLACMHCAKLIPGHDNTYIRNRFSLGAPLNIMESQLHSKPVKCYSLLGGNELGAVHESAFSLPEYDLCPPYWSSC